MLQQSRRKFVGLAARLAALTALPLAGRAATPESPARPGFIHHVYFWLKNTGSAEDKAQLVQGLRTLTKIKAIRMHHIGQPATTDRDVIDRSYAVSWLLFFKNKADQDSYQTDPVHLDFVAKYAHLWSKVVVYDTVDV